MAPHQQRKQHSEQNTTQSKPEVAQTNRLVALVEQGAREKTRRHRFASVRPAAVVGHHSECHYTPACWLRKAAQKSRRSEFDLLTGVPRHPRLSVADNLDWARERNHLHPAAGEGKNC